MARIRQEDVEAVRERTDIQKVVSQYLTLKKAGHDSLVGLCPFHTEKTPSFYVRPQTQMYHCFGCNKSGTAFDWLMEREHLEFGEALRTLATMTGVALPEHRDPEAEDQARRLYTIMEKVFEEISFEAPDMGEKKVVIDAEYVKGRLEAIVKDEDLSKFIL